MPKFILIDHSLRDIGGHHFDYALRILQAAEQQGYEIHIATNQDLNPNQLPAHWHVYPTFIHDIYSQYSMTSSWSSHGKRGLRYVIRKWRQVLLRGEYLQRFTVGVSEVLAKADPGLGDQVFLPTVTEVDLLGLQPIFANEHWQCGWHLLFHYNFLDGRTPDYASQGNSLRSMRKLFRRALKGSTSQKLHFYNPTTQLSDQYNRLGVANFHHLCHAVNPLLRRELEPRVEQPLRVTCAGGIRVEKGHKGIFLVVDRLWKDYLSTGRMKFVLQTNQSGFSIPLPNGELAGSGDQPIEYVGHPLSAEDYASLLGRADIGLLLYDSERYFSRCAGVLVEMLTVGVPVVVPAGCWLSEQIAPEIFAHLKLMWQQSKTAHGVALAWKGRHAPVEVEGVVEVGGPNNMISCTFDRQQNSDTLQVRFRQEDPLQPGAYVRVEVQQQDDAGCVVSSRHAIVGRCSQGGYSYTAFNLAMNTRQIDLRVCNAYGDDPISLIDIELQQAMTHAAPLGKVGMIATDPDSFAVMLAEVADNYAHYQQSAAEFSKTWSQQHDPAKIIEHLVARANAGSYIGLSGKGEGGVVS